MTSYDWLCSLAATPIGYALAPLAAAAWSPQVPLIAGAVVVATACLGTVLAPGVRRIGLPAPIPAPAAAEPVGAAR